jgi:hypothetical protein
MTETVAARGRPAILSRARRWIGRALLLGLTVLVTIIVGGALDARRRHPELAPWHRLVPASELTAADLGPGTTLEDYLRRERAVFEQVHHDIEGALPASERTIANRYNVTGVSSPSRLARDYNQTFEIAPAAPRGGVLLVHGLTDAPYSMRALAERFGAAGYYALALRMPGHGAVPGGLTRATWQAWMAAVRLGARHVRALASTRANCCAGSIRSTAVSAGASTRRSPCRSASTPTSTCPKTFRTRGWRRSRRPGASGCCGIFR